MGKKKEKKEKKVKEKVAIEPSLTIVEEKKR